MINLSEALQKKIKVISNGKAKTRFITKEEKAEIENAQGWFNGWFDAPNGRQIILVTRTNDQTVIFS